MIESSREEVLMLLQTHAKASPLVRHNLFATTHRQHRNASTDETILDTIHEEISMVKNENLVARTRSSALQKSSMLRATHCHPVRPRVSPTNQQESEISQTASSATTTPTTSNVSHMLGEVGLFNTKCFTASTPEFNAEFEEMTEPGGKP